MKQYAYSFTGENYMAEYDSKEAAINAAVESQEGLPFPYEAVYIGECTEPALRWTDQAEDVICSIRDCLQDDYGGDSAESFDDQVSREDKEGLGERINAAINGWINDYNITAGFYEIANEEKIDISDRVKEMAERAKAARAGLEEYDTTEQTPTEPYAPIGNLDSVPHYRCGRCKNAIVVYQNDEKPDKCPWCGVVIDWSDPAAGGDEWTQGNI